MSDVSTINESPESPTLDSPSGGSLLTPARPVPSPSVPARPRVKRAKRIKPPKDSKIYKSVMAWIALRATGATTEEIAEQLGLAKTTIKQYVYYANKKGWLNLESLANDEDRVDVVLKSKAVKNINVILDERVIDDQGNGHVTERAGQFALEVAKGTGLLKTHTATKVEATSQLGVALRVQVEMPVAKPNHPAPLLDVRPGTAGGQPYFDAEVLGDE